MSKRRRVPSKIKIGPHEYQVERYDLNQHLKDPDKKRVILGMHLGLRQKILLGKAHQSCLNKNVEAETLLHELVHGMTLVANVEDTFRNKRAEEEFTLAFSSVLYGVLRNNPQLVKYLTTK